MSTEIHLRTLRTSEGPTLDKLIALSNTIFDADPTSKYASPSLWKQRLSHPSSVIVYFTTEHGDEPIAFVFVHPRTFPHPLKTGTNESLHIWLAGVREDFRRRKCLDKMVDEVKRSSGNSEGQVLTLWTTPSRFNGMWQWTQSRGWSVEQEQGEKVLLSLSLKADV